VRPMAAWSMRITLFEVLDAPRWKCVRPVLSRDPYTSLANARYRISLISVDLPLPETPVTTVSSPSGTSTSDVLQIVLRGAPRIARHFPVGLPPFPPAPGW